MKLSDFLENVGHPIAYYPKLAGPLGGVNAAVLFCQLHYWLRRTDNDLGVHKTVAELREETGLSRTEQENARKALRNRGVLLETNRRLEHKIYFRLDVDRLEQLMEEAVNRPDDDDDSESGKPASPKAGNRVSRKQETCVRESGKPAAPNSANLQPPSGETCSPDSPKPAFVNGVKTTAETTAESSSNAREADAVDNSEAEKAAAADLHQSESQNHAASVDVANDQPVSVAVIPVLLAAFELKRGGKTSIHATRDADKLQAWADQRVTGDELRTAFDRAAKRRADQDCDKPINAGFLAVFIADVVSARSGAAAGAAGTGNWFESDSGINARGEEKGIKRAQNESTPVYLARVAAACGRGPWIDAALDAAKRCGATFYQQLFAHYSDQGLVADSYA